MGIPHISRYATCRLYPIQEVVWRLEAVGSLVPTSQAQAAGPPRICEKARASVAVPAGLERQLTPAPLRRCGAALPLAPAAVGFKLPSASSAAFSTRLDRRRIPRDVATTRWRDPSSAAIMTSACRRMTGQTAIPSANSEKAGRVENVYDLARKPAYDSTEIQPHSRHSLAVKPIIDARSGRRVGRNVEHGLEAGEEGARQRRAVSSFRPSVATSSRSGSPSGSEERLNPHQFQNRDEHARSARPSGTTRFSLSSLMFGT